MVGEHGLASPPCCGQAISRGTPVVFAIVAAATPLSTIEVIAGRRVAQRCCCCTGNKRAGDGC